MKNRFLIFFCLLSAIVFIRLLSGTEQFDKQALTPPMGWNSWNCFGCDINETLIRETAEAMVASGMKAVGYEYIIIDDCWQVGRDDDGYILADPQRFPGGMKALGDYIHSLGLKFGIYSCAGIHTCQGRPGSRGHQFQDALRYAEWGVDFLKYDWCENDGQNARAAYKTMSDALKASGRPVVFSICEWGENKPWEWGAGIGHLWRTTSDIQNLFQGKLSNGGMGVLDILDLQVDLWPYAGPGHWNDPDMLEVGNEGLSTEESRSHFTLWAMLAAPLIAGNDLRNMTPEIREILTNPEVITIGQNPMGLQGFRFLDMGDREIWIKFLGKGEAAVCFLNRSDLPWREQYYWQKFNVYHRGRSLRFDRQTYKLRDLWRHQECPITDRRLPLDIPGHGVLLLRLIPVT